MPVFLGRVDAGSSTYLAIELCGSTTLFANLIIIRAEQIPNSLKPVDPVVESPKDMEHGTRNFFEQEAPEEELESLAGFCTAKM